MKSFAGLVDPFIGLLVNKDFSVEPEKFEELFEKRFSLADLKISSRVLRHWSKYGLLPDENAEKNQTNAPEEPVPTKKRNRFNFVDLIYLNILQDLRLFGVSLPKLLEIKEFLLYEYDYFELLDTITNSDLDQLKSAGINTEMIGEVIEHKQEMKEYKELFPDSIRYTTVLSLILQGAILSKVDIRLIVTYDGRLSLEILNSIGQSVGQPFKQMPHIAIPIFHYLAQFVSINRYRDLFLEYRLLNDQELVILDLVKKGKYKEISIRPSKDNIITMELTEELKIENEARVRDILLKGGYQEIQLKTVKGLITYSEVTTKIRI